MRVMPVSEFRAHTKATLDELEFGEPILLVRRSRPVGVLVAPSEYALLFPAEAAS